MADWKSQATRAGLALAISAAGGFIGHALALPAGWLMGGALAVTIAALAGLPVGMPGRVRNIAFVLIGMSMGANVGADSLSRIGQWPVSIAGLVIELVLIISITGYVLARFFGLDRGTAYLSSFPGHLSFIIGIASAGVGDTRQIAIIQVIRILVLTVAVPVGTLILPIAHLPAPQAQQIMPPLTLLLLALGCAATGWVFVKLKVPAGFVLGAMAASGAAKLGGLFDAAMPPLLVVATFVMTGALIGSRFAGISRAELKTAALGGLLATSLTIGITTLVSFVVTLFVAMPFGQVWIGLAPGALEGMGALGIALGYDTAFIAAHHVIRLLLLSFAIPAVAVILRISEQRMKPGE